MYYVLTPSGSGTLQLGKELGKGGEGSVFAVEAHGMDGIPPASQLVAKVYHEPNAEDRPKKLKAMISNPVNDPAVAWPLAVILDENKRFLGYLMKRLDSNSYREWLYVANAKDRRKVAPAFDVRYAYAAVRNLAAAVLSVHAAGHRIGDINESNIFLGADATVLIVDTDSMQVSARDGAVFPCPVGKPEFTAPELTRGSLRDIPRTRETDIFAFAVAAYQLLTGGATPHQGAFDPNSEDDPLPQVERIRQGVLPSLDPFKAQSYGFTPRPGVPVPALPEFVKTHLRAFLSVEPENRNSQVTLQGFVNALDAFIPTLAQCPVEEHHWFPRGEQCGWCAEASKSKQDPWAGVAVAAPTQARLNPINFQDSSEPQGNGRAAAAIAGQQAHAANQQAAGTNYGPQVPQSYPQQGPMTQGAQGYPPQGQQQAPQQQQPQRPHKIKGKVVVDYADGSWGPRPPLGRLMRANPKLAIWALKEETPSPLKFWWPIDRDLASPVGLALGSVVGTALAFAWYSITLVILAQLSFIQLTASVASIIAWAPVVTAILASVILLFSGLNDRRKTKKKYGNLKNFKEEPFWKTAVRFLPLGFFYGVPIVLILLFLVVYLLLIFVRAVAKA